ncbi:MAG: DNA/RNA helicase domain-containing protein, partial [Woeseia sp.]
GGSIFSANPGSLFGANQQAEYIRDHATRMGCEISEFQLEAQFRCSGSEAFVNWISNTLGVQRNANILWAGDEGFDFRIMDSPDMLDAAVRQRDSEGATARLTAGFCWRWSDPKLDGTLVDDVQIGSFSRSWNAKPDAGRLASGIPKSIHWAHDPNGIEQIGCIYTAQGFEFDYVGVIWGPDLYYDPDASEWCGSKQASHDTVVKRSKEQFVDLIKNTYRVLLSRGMKGCYVYFMDKDTERFVRSRIDRDGMNDEIPRAAEDPGKYQH